MEVTSPFGSTSTSRSDDFSVRVELDEAASFQMSFEVVVVPFRLLLLESRTRILLCLQTDNHLCLLPLAAPRAYELLISSSCGRIPCKNTPPPN